MKRTLLTILLVLIASAVITAVADSVYGQVELTHEVTDAQLAQIEAKLLLYAGDVPDLPTDRLDRIEAIADHLLNGSKPPVVPDELKVNLNTGSLVELMSLDGIGEAKARDIKASREADGPFTDWRDVTTRGVGIGPATYKDLIAEGRAYVE